MQQVVTKQIFDYTCNSFNRLTGAAYDDGSSYAYTYDAVGNRLTENAKDENNQYTYDAANRLASVNGQAYTYDANANLLADGSKAYTYNYANRLTQVVSGTDTYQYLYNGLGDRLQSILNGTATTYSLDLNSSLTQVLADDTNNFTYGFNRIAQVSETQTGYFLGDALGSVRQVVDPQAEILLAQSYSPYGEVLSSVGDYETAYSYTGEMADGTGLVNLRARYYDPGIGSFISRDTWSGDYNNPITLMKWLCANGNPINMMDPTGQKACWDYDENGNCIVDEDWQNNKSGSTSGNTNPTTPSTPETPTVTPKSPISTSTPTKTPTSTPKPSCTPLPTSTKTPPICSGSFLACMVMPVENGKVGTHYGHQNTMDDGWDSLIGTDVPATTLSNGKKWEGGLFTKEDYLRLWGIHAGVDIYPPSGNNHPPILSVFTGKVVRIMNSSTNGGNRVVIEHKFNGETFYSIYFHIQTIINQEDVKTGTQIGTMGNTGMKIDPKNPDAGIHLHFEVRTSTGLNVYQSPDWYWANSPEELHSNWVDISSRFGGYDPFLPNDWR